MKKSPRRKTKSILRKAIVLTPALLRRWPLPEPSAECDKQARGSLLVIGGSEGMPGPVVLAALAGLRAGAGRLRIATPESLAPWVALSVWESLVTSLPQRKGGALSRRAATKISVLLEGAHTVLIGPGMFGERETISFTKALIRKKGNLPMVADAEALKAFRRTDRISFSHDGLIITPHAGEMADILGIARTEVEAAPAFHAAEFARQMKVVTVLKGKKTFIAGPKGELFCNEAGNVGLAISGSGDALSGVIAGLSARGAEAVQAAAWGVFLHARAGELLAREIGPIGYLPRELLREIPAIMAKLKR